MKKHLTAALAALTLLLAWVLPAAAASPGLSNTAQRQFRAGFVQDSRAYLYLQMEENQLAEIGLGLKVQDTVLSQQSSGFIREGSRPVHYLLLVDCSSTVRNDREEIALFGSSLLQQTLSGGGTAIMTVAGLGDSFRILAEGTADPAVLKASLDALPYSDRNTDLYGGIQAALSYIQNQPHSAGELYQMVLVTDGRQDKQGQLGLTQEQLDQLEASFAQRQDVIFHTCGVSEVWHGQELQQAELGRGCHLSLVEALPEEAAQTIADFTNALYQGVFTLDAQTVPAPGESLQVQVLFDDQPGGTSVVEIPVLNPVSEAGNAGQASPGSQADSGSTSLGPEASAESPGSSGAGPEQPSSSQEMASPAPSEESVGDWGRLAVWLLLPVAVLAALGGWLLHRQVDTGKRPEKAAVPPPGSVCIHVQVERGRCITKERTFYLVDELIIGRSPACDLVFDEPDVSDQNTRILMWDGDPYIEDLDSFKGTSIGGMRIYAPNRLRSGDVITISTAVQIRIAYEKN